MQNLKLKIQNYKSKFKIFKFCIFILSFAFCILNLHRASAAVLYSQAANQDTYEGQTFVVDWYLDTENQSSKRFGFEFELFQRDSRGFRNQCRQFAS
jgi:hypothetical protein